MAVTLRLMRLGKKSNPVYRVVAIDKHKKRTGRYIEIVGFYDPVKNPPIFSLDQKKISDWIKKGATVSEGFRKLLKNKKIKTD